MIKYLHGESLTILILSYILNWEMIVLLSKASLLENSSCNCCKDAWFQCYLFIANIIYLSEKNKCMNRTKTP